jgi:Na+/proline symporter/signal transduction histidine kinase
MISDSMLLSDMSLGLILVGYVLFILANGWLAEKMYAKHSGWIDNGVVYSLALGIYCTAWTMFGSIQLAANSGMLFFAVYLGPALGAIFWWPILSRLVRIKNRFQITSLADFIAARYDKSVALGVLVSLLIVVGFVPYIALQIRSLSVTTELLLSDAHATRSQFTRDYLDLFLVGAIIVVTLIIGLRRVVTTSRNPALVATLAVESVLKLGAALVVGIFIVYFLNDGILPALEALPKLVPQSYSFMGSVTGSQFLTWVTYLLLAMCAVLFLPRQFQVVVIENSNEKHILTARWLFPLFLLLINLFVLPIAIYGLKAGLPASQADSFLMSLPLKDDHHWVGIIAFLGGLSASLGMIVMAGTTLSTMVTNQIFAPLIGRFSQLSRMKRQILKIRWAVAALVISLAYFYQKGQGSTAVLVSMGMISFLASMQFVPTILAGLFWEKVSRKGAVISLLVGGGLWFYTAFFPALARGGMIFSADFVTDGPFGMSWLRPEALFGLVGLSAPTHSFLWSTTMNVVTLILGSLAFPAQEAERNHAKDFLDSGVTSAMSLATLSLHESAYLIELAPKMAQAKGLFELYFDSKTAKDMLAVIWKKLNFIEREKISVGELADLNFEMEVCLAGAIGTVASHRAVKEISLISKEEQIQLADFISTTISSLGLSPRELKEKVNFHQEKEKLLKEYTREIEERLQTRTMELEASHQKLIQAGKMASLGEMAGGIAHEVNTPLATISLCVGAIDRRLSATPVDPVAIQKSLTTIKKTVERIAIIIRGLRTFSRADDSVNMPFEKIRPAALLEETLSLCMDRVRLNDVTLTVTGPAEIEIHCRPVHLSQVIINLIGNSIDAIAGQSEKWIKIDYALDGETLRLQLTDSGPGIPVAIADKIMQPFFTTKEVGKGTGLGLSVSAGIIRSHHGKFFIDQSCPNTRFVIELPLNPAVEVAS